MCTGAASGWVMDASLPALAAAPAPLDTGMTITGTGIHLGAAGGQVDLAGATWELVPFNTVDCTTCPGGPWYELHSMLLRAGEACFTILYLRLNVPGSVQLGYTLCLPTLDRPDAVYTASWSGTPLAKQRATPRLWRPAAPPSWRMREAH